jgi:uncharacterized protein HemX
MPPEIVAGPLPPVLAFVVVLAGLGLRWMKQRGADRNDEWTRMRQLLDELRQQRDRDAQQLEQRDALIEQQAAHITQLRRDLREALRNLDHEPETP